MYMNKYFKIGIYLGHNAFSYLIEKDGYGVTNIVPNVERSIRTVHERVRSITRRLSYQ